jgi:hypothetical protein
MRRIPATLLVSAAALVGGLTLAAAPAGATGLPSHLIRPLTGGASAGAHAHITSSVPPTTLGYIESVDSSDNLSYSSATVQAPVDPSGVGNTVNFRLVGAVAGVGSTVSVAVTVATGTSQPVQAGKTYGTGASGSADLVIGTQFCGSETDGQSAVAYVDQLHEVAGVITSAAIQVACSTGSQPLQALFGSYAYNVAPTTPHQGYYTYESDGALTGYGNDHFLNYLGDLSAFALNQPVVGMAQTADGDGYWMVASDGGIFAYGDAGFYGSMGGAPLNKPIVGMAATPDGKGYWLVASDGGIFAFGDAAFYGSTGAMTLNKPIVGMAVTPSGKGYWLVASDGGIFAYGDAGFYGSTGNISLNKPVVGMTPTADGKGYWFVASDGGVFAYGDAGFYGSAGATPLNQPIVGMASTADGKGYWFIATDGGIFAYGDAPYYGSLPGDGVSVTDVAGLSTLPGLSF